MTKAILVDDKPTNLKLLESLLRDYCPSVSVVALATGTGEAYRQIVEHMPQIVFLDVEMPGGDGFDLIHKFNPVFFEVIFTTAYSQYAVRAFREQAMDYLLKPIDIDHLQQAVAKAEGQIALKESGNRLLRYLEQQEQVPATGKIPLPALDGYTFVDPDNIMRCEASGSYTLFYLTDGQKIMVSMRLKACEQLLPGARFFRVHHSHIVNLAHIQKYVKGRGGSIELLDGTTIDVAATRKDEFLKTISGRRN